MGSVYLRGDVLWLAYLDASGKRRCVSSGLRAGMESDARAALRAVEREVSKQIRDGTVDEGPLTVVSYGRRFCAARKRAGVGVADDEEARFRNYIAPFRAGELDGFDRLLMVDVRPHHIRDFVRHLKALELTGERSRGRDRKMRALAPRTIRHIYGQLRVMFREAVTDGVIAATPCVLAKGDLPKKVDKDPTWRSRAIYARPEVEALMSDERIPLIRRVRYAGLFLTGMRVGELAARLWRDIDAQTEPLGRIDVNTSFSRKRKRIKGVKTDRPRQVPIHPVLARVLAAWKLSGWAQTFGRQPGLDDLVWPSATLQNLRDPVVLKELREDCAKLGFPPRRTHDTRRTLISFARTDGANKDTFRQITHQPEGDQMDEYTTLPWSALCAEMSKVKLNLLDGKLLQMPAAANAGGTTMELLQSPLQSKAKGPQPVSIAALSANQPECPGRDSNPHKPAHDATTESKGRQVSRTSGLRGATRHMAPRRSVAT
jgi:integrase